MREALLGIALLLSSGASLHLYAAVYATNVTYGCTASDGTDDTAGLQAAIYAATNQVDKTVILPPGYLKITARLTVPEGVIILGQGMTTSQIQLSGSSAMSGAFIGSNYALRNLEIKSQITSGTRTAGTAITASGATNLVIESVNITGVRWNRGIYISDAANLDINNLRISLSGGYAGIVLTSVTNAAVENVNIGQGEYGLRILGDTRGVAVSGFISIAQGTPVDIQNVSGYIDDIDFEHYGLEGTNCAFNLYNVKNSSFRDGNAYMTQYGGTDKGVIIIKGANTENLIFVAGRLNVTSLVDPDDHKIGVYLNWADTVKFYSMQMGHIDTGFRILSGASNIYIEAGTYRFHDDAGFTAVNADVSYTEVTYPTVIQ
jgi:hypothetical protein